VRHVVNKFQSFGFRQGRGGEEVFKQLTAARLNEPTSKSDSIRVLDGMGISAASYRT